MSVSILYSKITDTWFIEQYEQLTSLLNRQDKQRFDKMKNQVKRKQFVLSRFLLQQAVFELLNEDKIKSKNNSIEKNRLIKHELGKHFIQSYQIENYHKLIINQQYHFSISITHSGSIAAVCVSNYQLKLGIDVEKIKSRSFIELSAEICTPDELAIMKEGQYQPVSFYQLWTTKEALTKAMVVNLRESFLFDSSQVLKKNSGVINLAKELFSYNTICLSHEPDSFVGTIVVGLLNCDHLNNNSCAMSSELNSDVCWQYYSG